MAITNDLYTTSLMEVMANPDYQNLFENLELDTEEQTKTFLDMFVGMYRFHEIAGETIPQFKLYIEDTFTVKKTYYQELINAYETKVNMLDGVVTTTESDDVTDNIELPNKVVDPDDIDKYINNRNKGKSNGKVTSNDNIDLKRRYMKLLRNVYEKFVLEFMPCFITLYN